MDIQVGDLVTYKNETKFNVLKKVIVNESELDYYQKQFNNKSYELLKIERQKYEVIEEHKELLTEEEKEFLKDITKWYNNISTINFNQYIDIYEGSYIINCLDYPSNLEFQSIEKYKLYTLEELGIN